MYKLIALDMDGTLLTSEKVISEDTKEALKKAEERLIDQANRFPSFRPIAYEMLGVLTEYIKENL